MSSSSKLFAENAASATRTTPTAANRLDRLGPARSPKPDPLAAEDADASVAAPAGRDSGDNNTAVSAAPGVVALALDVTDSCKGNFCALACGSVLFTPIGASGAVAASGAAFVFAGVFAVAVFAGVFTVFAFAVFAGVLTVFAFAFTVFTVAFAVFTVFTVAVFAAFAVAVFAVAADSRIGNVCALACGSVRIVPTPAGGGGPPVSPAADATEPLDPRARADGATGDATDGSASGAGGAGGAGGEGCRAQGLVRKLVLRSCHRLPRRLLRIMPSTRPEEMGEREDRNLPL